MNMNIVRPTRLLTKLAALAALAISITYLQKPQPLYALTCRQECQAIEKRCITGCGTSYTCDQGCINTYKVCVTGCA